MSRPWIANRGEAYVEQMLRAPDNTVCISITEPNRPEKARLPKGFAAILRLEFQDYDQSFADGTPRKHPAGAVFMSKTQAARIARFARKHRGQNILVHCAAGISRSGAVVEALLEAFQEYEDRGWPRHPNNHVKTLLKRALGLVPIGAEDEDTA